jgi:hypothetical protein
MEEVMAGKLIGLAGKKGVGKNFVASLMSDAICEEDVVPGKRQSFEYAAFADPLKDFLINVLLLDEDKIKGSDEDKNTATQYEWSQMPSFVTAKFPSKSGRMTIRDILQIFGTEMIREIWGYETWINAMERRVKKSWTSYFVITDCRFANEVEAVRRWGGEAWLIDGPQRGQEAAKKDSHSSENSLDGVRFDRTIHNGIDDNATSLIAKIKQALSEERDGSLQ